MTLSRISMPKSDDEPTPNSTEILSRLALDQLITKTLDARLKEENPLLVLIAVKSPSWARALREQLTRRYPQTCVRSYKGDKRSASSQEEDHLLLALNDGQSGIGVSTDIVAQVPEALRNSADFTLYFAGLSPVSLRKAIGLVTGQPVRRLPKLRLDGLDLADLAAAIRPGSTPAQCIKRLQLTLERKASDLGVPDDAVPVSALPLSPEVRAWSEEVLTSLRLLEEGKISMRRSPFSVLAGPTGSGKSKLAEAIAKAAGWQLIQTSAQDWFDRSDGFLGGVARQTNSFFQSLENNPKTIGFVDEIEAIPDRATMDERNREWWTTIVTGILVQVDRLRRSPTPALLIGATNYPERVDSALLRHGRLGRLVRVEPPRDLAAITDIFRYYLKEDLRDDELLRLVHMSMAFGHPTPASVENWVGAARVAAMAAGRSLTLLDLETAIGGTDDRPHAERYRVAIHEAGHAVIAAHLDVPISSVSIIGQPGSAGSMLAEIRTTDLDRHSLEHLVTVALAGRAADQILLGLSDAAATSDLKLATRLLFNAHFVWGLYDHLTAIEGDTKGPLVLDPEARGVIDAKLQELLVRAQSLVGEHRESIERLADALLRARVISGTAVRDLVLKSRVWGPAPRERAKP
ncbi:AAA family ATPase [Devosia sp. MC521]|uniref:AAA family ATPase n=1 Tax=Devosia sp. MC521 TaxID=2759954 RepID=UPI0015F7AE3A|nr:AAA family ATPase [Devosia sp. MC521]MBJ6989216.1 AAA family ATPase [Devosia sp. MC521]QMW63286.1 AAA family ATPase [Devosia sp. MC521]